MGLSEKSWSAMVRLIGGFSVTTKSGTHNRSKEVSARELQESDKYSMNRKAVEELEVMRLFILWRDV